MDICDGSYLIDSALCHRKRIPFSCKNEVLKQRKNYPYGTEPSQMFAPFGVKSIHVFGVSNQAKTDQRRNNPAAQGQTNVYQVGNAVWSHRMLNSSPTNKPTAPSKIGAMKTM